MASAKARIAQKDVVGWKGSRAVKKMKNRAERRAAKQNPEIASGYGKYAGWVS